MLRGSIASSSSASDQSLLVYQERPLDGREVRFREEFPLVFPEFTLALVDGHVAVQPNMDSERSVSYELHRMTLHDREFTGFQTGDIVTVQGGWQPANRSHSTPAVLVATSVSGAEKATLLAEVQAAMEKVQLARNGLGVLTAVSIVTFDRTVLSTTQESDTFTDRAPRG